MRYEQWHKLAKNKTWIMNGGMHNWHSLFGEIKFLFWKYMVKQWGNFNTILL